MSKTEETINALEDAMTLNSNNADFLPQQDLHKIITKEAIEAVLRESIEAHLISDTIQQVLDGAQKTFAILILSRCAFHILEFIRLANPHGFPVDGKLPYEKIESLTPFQLSNDHKNRFFKNQWKFTAPIFDFNSVLPVSLHNMTRLPFLPIDGEGTPVGVGGFGEVYRVLIEPRHQKVQTQIVRKEMSGSERPNEFEKELTNMSILKQIRHPNIIQLLAAYSYKRKYNLIFPQADGGSLKDLFDGKLSSEGLESTETLMVAIAGLSSALCEVHNLSFDSIKLMGCHRDLKPSNILIDKSDLLLADFGLSRFKSSDESSRSKFQQGQGDYLAPECEDLEFKDPTQREIGRSSDIWSLGCVLLELLTYLVDGSQGVQDFRLRRKRDIGRISVYRFYSGNKEPSKDVVAWQEELDKRLARSNGRQPRFPKVLQHLLFLVGRTLAIEPEKRPKAAEIEVILRGLATYSLTQEIVETFSGILQKGVSYRPLQERRRFESWLAVCKVDGSLEDVEFKDAWLGESFSNFRAVIKTLYELRYLLGNFKARLESQTERKRYQSNYYRQLHLLNNTLLGFLPSRLQETAEDHSERMILANPSWKFLEDLWEGKEVLHKGDLLKRLAAIKLWHANLEKQSRKAQPSLDIGPKDLRLKGPIEGVVKVEHLETTYGQRPQTLLELKPLQEGMIKNDNLNILRKRLKNMVTLLQNASRSGFPVLNCLGVYQDPAELRLGLLYDFPENSDGFMTLAAILGKEVKQYPYPMLGERFKLAHELATSLHKFLKISWLHRNVKASNIAFFRSKDPQRDRPDVFFLGFAHSRLMTDKEYTEGAPEDWDENYYLDPDYVFSEHFRPYHDHYALGIVLLEIGFWKPLRDVYGDFLRVGKLVHTEFRQHALKVLVPEMGVRMGEMYRDAVTACLDGTLRNVFREYGDDEAQKRDLRLQEEFKRLVVDKLERLFA
ncbi:MAG: hypothetical protein Q9225_004301 [Loekoesia sp. 1 TL-2023]